MKGRAFISGAARGIGRAVALALAGRGFDVALNDREHGPALGAVCEAAAALGVRAQPCPGDAADPAVQPALLEQAEAALGPLSTLICNAGVGALQRGDVLESTVESFEHCARNNARGPFFLMQAFARRVLAAPPAPGVHRAIVVISSINAVMVSTTRGEYCVSKAGAAMATQVFAARLAPAGVQVVDIQPGIIETDLTRPVMDDYRRRIDAEGLTLEARSGQPGDVAAAAVLVATGALPYAPGQVLRVDGGLSLRRF